MGTLETFCPGNSAAFAEFGGARRDRTADLLHAMQALSQLSYGPTGWKREIVERIRWVVNTLAPQAQAVAGCSISVSVAMPCPCPAR